MDGGAADVEGGRPAFAPDEFRAVARRLADLIADYHAGLRAGGSPVRSPLEPGDVAGALPESAPQHGEGWDAILEDVARTIVPGLTHWQHPRFFGYFPANASDASMLGDFLSAGLGVQGMLWQTSPACTELETRVLDWLAAMLGLPASFVSGSAGGGVIQGTASEAALVALVAARDRARRAEAGSLAVYASTQAHSSVAKAAAIAGLDAGMVRSVPTDGALAMDPGALQGMLERDARGGVSSAFVCATLGTTSTGAMDPVSAIAAAADGARLPGGAWLHVDAAWAGSAFVCEEHRAALAGVERADSFCTNPHKWLLTNFDCCAMWVRDRGSVTGALSVTPEYLRNEASESGRVIDYRDWQVPLGRRFRALKLWFVIRRFGVSGLRAHVRRGIRHGERFAAHVEGDADWALVVPRSLSLVCAAHRGGDGRTRAAMDRVNASGAAFLTHTVVPGDRGGGRLAVRFAAGGAATTDADVDAAWAALRDAGG